MTYLPDLVVNAVLNRAMQLLHGFVLLVRNRQYLCAAPLVRLQLDNGLRLYAGGLVSSFDEFTSAIMAGDRIDRMRTPAGERLTDQLLISRLATSAPWLPEMYEKASGYVHFSGAHLVGASLRSGLEDRTLRLNIYREADMPEDGWLGLLQAFDGATRLVLGVVDAWNTHKEGLGPDGEVPTEPA